MKKALAILTAFLLCALLPAFGEEAALTIGDLMRANSTRAILDAHENLIMAYETEDGVNAIYADEKVKFTLFRSRPEEDSDGDTIMLMTSDGCMVREFFEDEGSLYSICYFLLGTKYGSQPYRYTPDTPVASEVLYSDEMTRMEKVIACEAEADEEGLLAVTTVIGAEEMEEVGDDRYPSGCSFRGVYHVDPDTLLFRATEEYIVYPNGTEKVIGRETVYTDVEKTGDILEMEELLDGFLHAEKKRTVTFVFDPGEVIEETVRVTGAIGFLVIPVYNNNLGYTMYSDRNCTVPCSLSDDDLTGDRVFYLRRELPPVEM